MYRTIKQFFHILDNTQLLIPSITFSIKLVIFSFASLVDGVERVWLSGFQSQGQCEPPRIKFYNFWLIKGKTKLSFDSETLKILNDI